VQKSTAFSQKWRQLASNYTDIGVVVYDEQNFYADETLSLMYTTIGSLTAAMICMSIVCIFFISGKIFMQIYLFNL
jgi:hypothetical protein